MVATVPFPGAARTAVDDRRVRWGAGGLAAAGILFVLYPAVRPYPDDAMAMASTAWVGSHLFAVFGFVLLTLGLGALWTALAQTHAERLAFHALMATGIGAGLVLPYYGAEVFALHAIGQQSLQEQNPALLDIAEAIRFGPAAAVLFAAGLLLLAVGPVLAAAAIQRSGVLPPVSGIPLALGFVLFLPQFFGPPPIRIAHGVLIALGCIWVALGMWRARRSPADRLRTATPAK